MNPFFLTAAWQSITRSPRPAASEPGSLYQQLEVIDLYLSNPARRHDPRGSWQLARRLILPHARRIAA